MSVQYWERVKDLFARAVELPETEQQDFLALECSGDMDLLDEIRSLLASHNDTKNLVEENALDLNEAFSDRSNYAAGKKLGHYEIVGEVGHGGMGSVFLARRVDGDFDQTVALKVIRQSLPDKNLERHFRLERQILASLNHANIARLIDGGVTDNNELFFAMEYIEGEPLLDFADRRELTTDERLLIFLKISRAVSYAHQNLIVHRDIKPSNILVDKDGQPKLLDFGLAKIITSADGEDPSEQTQTAFRAFTPAYASPEQVLGKMASTASDQYSLGVVLFELLTGSKPYCYEGKSIEEIVSSFDSLEPPAPSAIISSGKDVDQAKLPHLKRKALSKDLDNITLKALRKEPERRYNSVEALADDIERHLKGLPVTARPSTFAYLASRFVKRNRIAVGAGIVVVMALLAGLTVAIWQARIARQERDRAEARFSDVRKLSNSLLFEIAPKIERLQGSVEARELLVRRALEYLDSLAGETRDDEGLQAELALAYQKVGDLQGNPSKPNLSDFAGAIESYEKSKAILKALPQSVETDAKLAATFRELAAIRFAQSEIKGSLEDSEAALEILNRLRTENPDSIDLAKAFNATRLEHGHTFAINNQYDIAIPIYLESIQQLSGLDQRDPETKRLFALGNAYLSNGLSWNDQQSEAEAVNEKAVSLAEELRREHPNDANIQQTILTVFNLASSTFEGIKNDVALGFAAKALAVARRSAELDPADTQARQNLGKAFSRYGIVLTLSNRVNEGFGYLNEAEKTMHSLILREPRNRVYQDDIGTLYTRFGDAEEKRSNLTGALEAYKKSAEIFHGIALSDEKNLVARRDWAQAVKSVGVVQIKLGQKHDARISLNQAIDIVGKLKQQGALGKWDEKTFNEMQPLLDKLN